MSFYLQLVFFCYNVITLRHSPGRGPGIMPTGQLLRSPLTINQKLFLLIIFCICVPFLAMGWSWYRSSTDTIEQSAIDTNKRIIEQTNSYLDLYFSNLENSTYPFLNHPQIQQFLNAPSLTSYQNYQMSVKVESDLFTPMIYGRTDILGMSVVAKNGRQINDFSRTSEPLDMDIIRVRNAALLKRIDTLDNYQVIGTSRIGSTPVVTVARKLHSNETYLYEGLLVVDLTLQQIEHISKTVSAGGFNVWISTADGWMVYHPDPARSGSRVPVELRSQFDDNRPGHYFRTPGEEIVLYDFSRTTGWIVAADIPLNRLIDSLLSLRNASLTAAVILLVFTLTVLGGYSMSITRSLSFLKKLMARVEHGDFMVRPHPLLRRKDEIGSMFRSFSRMVGELNGLIKEVHSSKLKEQELVIKQKESALKSMQAHINPHFLYNSLEIINSHAIVSDNKDISRMTGALAHIFRYNIGNASQIATLGEEIGHIGSYLEIQKARFRHLTVEMSVDDYWLSRVETVRLALQPLVENAFIHGYRNRKPAYIGIVGRPEKTYFCITIADRGAGMPAELAERFNHLFEGTPEPGEDALAPTSGIGILNVHQRLRLTFGENFGLKIAESSAESGTRFEIRLPYRQEGKEE